ncbi:MAG: hypothetical protein JJ939_11570 [Alphaproteobacteria bacterium]|nr:hypothetical protein [Alphaproteobacteria bacterium]MBO6629054.1 hypothetical protein [Alphaproteobacteria bacterium]
MNAPLTRAQIIEITDKDIYSVLFAGHDVEQVEPWGQTEEGLIEGIFDEAFDDALAIFVTNFASRSVDDVTKELAEKAFKQWDNGARSLDEFATLPAFIKTFAADLVDASERETAREDRIERRHQRGLTEAYARGY